MTALPEWIKNHLFSSQHENCALRDCPGMQALTIAWEELQNFKKAERVKTAMRRIEELGKETV